MLRKLAVFFILSAILFSFCLYSRNDFSEWTKNQKYIDGGRDLDDRMNRLGTVLVNYIEKRIKKMNDEDWRKLRLNERRLYYAQSFQP